MQNIKLQVKEILNKTLVLNTVDEFVSFNLANDLVGKKFNVCYEDLNKLFNSLTTVSTANQATIGDPVELEQQLRKDATLELVNHFFEQKHTKKQLVLLRVIAKLASSRSIEVRYVCEYMLNNLFYNNCLSTNNPNPNTITNLNHSKNISNKTTPYIWCKVLEFIRKLIPGLDYKSCRDIFKMLLEVVKRIPHSNSDLPLPLENEMPFTKSINKHKIDNDYKTIIINNKQTLLNTSAVTDDIKLESLYETISFLLDQENYFMPRYLAINEIKSVLTFGKEAYHPRFHYMFTMFIESFIPTAHLISISGREKLLPIVGCSNLYSSYSFWRFNPSTCKFNTSGPLPYFKHVSKPHHEVFFYLLRQNAPQYLLMSLMSVHRNIKTRFPLFEDEFSSVILDTMNMTEQIPDRDYENLRIWNNLVNQLVNLNQIIHLPALIHHLATRLKSKGDNFEASRNWLMWFLLLIMAFYNNKNFIPEFSDLYEILYKDDEVLPNPDLNKLISVVKLAPLSIWIHLNWKMLASQNQEGASGAALSAAAKSKTLITPEIIKNHAALLQDCMSTQHFNDFGLSICMNAYSIETPFFSPSFNNLLEKIGKSVLQQSANLNQSSNIGSPNGSGSNSIFTNHSPISIEMIASFTLHVRMLAANYLTCILIQKPQLFKLLTFNIPAAIVETFARLITYDPDNFIKYFTQNLWAVLITSQPHNLPQPLAAYQQQQQQQQIIPQTIQLSFLHQQLNLLIEMIAFRLKNLSFTHRTTFLYFLNSLFAQPNQQTQQQQQPIIYIKHPQIYLNAQCAMLKMLSSFTGSDHYELLNSILASTSKHQPKYFINPDEEINKAIVIVVARAIHLTASDLHPLENKDKDDAIRNLLRDVMKMTPIYFPDYVIQHFPKVVQDFFVQEQTQIRSERIYVDSSFVEYKNALKNKVEEDYIAFLETQNQLNFQNQNPVFPVNTLFCVMFKFLQDETIQQQNIKTYLSFILNYLSGLDNRKMTQAMRTFCDYLINESSNKPKTTLITYVTTIIKMIRDYNMFTYDRLLMIMSFRSFDSFDYQLSLDILNILFTQNEDFLTKYNDYIASMNSNPVENDEWNPMLYYNYIRKHQENFFYEGLKEQLNIQSNDSVINTYYGSVISRCVPVLDFINNRYIELNTQSQESDSLLDQLNALYKFYSNPISYVYNSFTYYNNKFETTLNNPQMELMVNKSKKKRLLYILANRDLKQFSQLFQAKLHNQNMPINHEYYYGLIQRLVKRMLDIDQPEDFNTLKSEFQNPSCHVLYMTLCELICLELFENDPITFSRNICQDIIDLFFKSRFEQNNFPIENNHLAYWINAAGLLIANLPESYWIPIYERIAIVMSTDASLNTTEPPMSESNLLDSFDLYLADEKNWFNQVTLIIALFHSVWCHSNANHFQYFVKFLKERRTELVKTETHFLFICKLIGPFLSKIHVENTNLLITLVEELYDMIQLVDQSNTNLYYMETICNFFYHLKYRHIGESIKEKIHSLMPNFRPELKKLFKYITSELNQQQQQQFKATQNSPPSIPLIGTQASRVQVNSNPRSFNLN